MYVPFKVFGEMLCGSALPSLSYCIKSCIMFVQGPYCTPIPSIAEQQPCFTARYVEAEADAYPCEDANRRLRSSWAERAEDRIERVASSGTSDLSWQRRRLV